MADSLWDTFKNWMNTPIHPENEPVKKVSPLGYPEYVCFRKDISQILVFMLH
jgi:hypothetical protein